MEVRAAAKSNRQHTVGDVAHRFGVPTNVLRYWEDKGLLHPDRTTGNQRRYTQDDLFTIAFIIQGKELGFELETIGELLHSTTAEVRWARLRDQVRELDAKIERLEQARNVVAAGLECPHDDFLDCPWFRQHLTKRMPSEPGA